MKSSCGVVGVVEYGLSQWSYKEVEVRCGHNIEVHILEMQKFWGRGDGNFATNKSSLGKCLRDCNTHTPNTVAKCSQCFCSPSHRLQQTTN
jgi:hypothetical protein